jgi:predicted alpha/beta-fold hydrolase
MINAFFMMVGLGWFSGLSLAAELKNGPQSEPALVGIVPILATAAPNLKALPSSVITDHQKRFTLADGTVISGLYFKADQESSEAPIPLFLANFGLFSDEYSAPISFFVNSLVLTGKLKADVMIVDSVTSGEFYALNQEMGLGGYDEGRILVELADSFRSEENSVRPTYLFGVSLGGNAVIQALLEDQREGGQRFKGAISFSGVLDEEKSSQQLMTSFGHSLSEMQSGHLGVQGLVIANSLLLSLNSTLTHESPGAHALWPWQVGDFYYQAFQKRLNRLSKTVDDHSWNPSVQTDSVEDYVHSSSDLIQNVNQLKVPLIVIHSKNDPIVPFSEFKAFQKEQMANPEVLTHSTFFGGHWGFFDTYGADWVNEWINQLSKD